MAKTKPCRSRQDGELRPPSPPIAHSRTNRIGDLMPFIPKLCSALLGLSLLCLSMPSQAVKARQATAVASTAGAWRSSQKENAHQFDYTAKVYLLGKATTITLAFFCDSAEGKDGSALDIRGRHLLGTSPKSSRRTKACKTCCAPACA